MLGAAEESSLLQHFSNKDDPPASPGGNSRQPSRSFVSAVPPDAVER
jgi:hypothetical protein